MMVHYKNYEIEAIRHIKRIYNSSLIQHNQKVLGKFSRALRQLDIKVTSPDGQFGFFDCKCYTRKVDVKKVEEIIGMYKDVGAQFCGIITTAGFTKSATHRGDTEIDFRPYKMDNCGLTILYMNHKMDFSKPENSMYIAVLV